MNFTNRTISIPAASGGVPGIYSEPVSGRHFTCISATGSFILVTDNDGRRLSMSRGRSFEGNQVWSRMTFYNTSAAIVTVEYYAGLERYVGDVNVAAAVTANITNDIAENTEATPVQFLNTALAADAPEAFTAAQTYFRKAIVYGINTLSGTVNTSDVKIGPSGAANEQPIVIPPGGEYTLEPPNGCKWNFEDWFFKVATNGDGIVVIYT